MDLIRSFINNIHRHTAARLFSVSEVLEVADFVVFGRLGYDFQLIRRVWLFHYRFWLVSFPVEVSLFNDDAVISESFQADSLVFGYTSELHNMH